MITQGWAFRVWGDPQPKGSMKCIGAVGGKHHQLVEDNKDSPAWRVKVAGVAAALLAKGQLEAADNHQPIMVEITSTLERPQTHYGTGRNADVVKPSSPVWPSLFGTGDIDKLERLVLDALADAHVLTNDAQVTRTTSSKWYAGPNHHGLLGALQIAASDVLDRPGIVVRVRPAIVARSDG